MARLQGPTPSLHVLPTMSPSEWTFHWRFDFLTFKFILKSVVRNLLSVVPVLTQTTRQQVVMLSFYQPVDLHSPHEYRWASSPLQRRRLLKTPGEHWNLKTNSIRFGLCYFRRRENVWLHLRQFPQGPRLSSLVVVHYLVSIAFVLLLTGLQKLHEDRQFHQNWWPCVCLPSWTSWSSWLWS